ncbi:MAG: hypothetical protein BAJALOKI1v1_40019 [Promethearchaeota archaeon]|nr:MAG: hypothetical protein BAJALOKI1v1_40019 [Candidatus Lokiarchaeota archaeon]
MIFLTLYKLLEIINFILIFDTIDIDKSCNKGIKEEYESYIMNVLF